jgi:hypothetical protein
MKNNYKKAKMLFSSAAFFLAAWSAGAQAPVNDDCAAAVTLTVNTGFGCTTVTPATTVAATMSLDPECSGNPDDDVWFQFTATGEVHSVSLLNIMAVQGTSTDMYFEVFEGTCDNLSSHYCSDADTDLVTGLTAGENYYIRVYSYYNTSRQSFNICLGSLPAAPANDDCAAAVALTVNPDYSCTAAVAGTTAGATMSMEADPCYGNPDDDVWYSFVATTDTHRIALNDIEPVIGWGTDLYFQVLEGTCDGLGSLLCSDPESGNVEGLTPGETYYVRVYSYAENAYQTFNICIGTNPPPPLNDDCAGAIALTVNPDMECDAVTEATTVSATESLQVECSGNTDDDVWFSFVATGENHIVSLTDIEAVLGWSTDMYFQVYEGTCDGLNSLQCSDNETAIVTGLTAGETYYMRVYSYGGDSRQNFSICIATPPVTPANDDCSGAVALTVNPTMECTAVTSGSTISATESMQADPCGGNPDDDVWYSFTATAEAHYLSLTNIESIIGWGNDMYFQVLQGVCDGQESVLCSDNEEGIVSGLTPGEVYYVRVYTYPEGVASNFDICVGTVPAAPANDNCAGAVSLTVNPGLDCTAVTQGTTLSATESMQADPCNGNPDDDVWYSFVATAETHVVSLLDVEPVTGWSDDMYFQVLSGACDGQESILCSDDESNLAEGLTPGETYYIRVYSYSMNQFNTFNICVGTMPPPPAYDDCEGAIAITAGAEFETNAVVVSNAGSTDSENEMEPGCASYDGADIWFTVEIPASGSLTIETQANAGSQLEDSGMAIYTGQCGGLTEIACDDDSGIDTYSLIELEDMTPGEVVYIRLWEYGGDIMGSFRLSAYDGSLSAEDFSADASFRHYPNPVKDVLNLSYVSDITSVAVYNMLGQQVLSKEVNAAETTVDMSALADGAYIVQAAAGNTVKTLKVIKKQ